MNIWPQLSTLSQPMKDYLIGAAGDGTGGNLLLSSWIPGLAALARNDGLPSVPGTGEAFCV